MNKRAQSAATRPASVGHSRNTLARRLKIQHLVMLETVVRAGSLVAAARELHTSQPALSKAIHELESHFGRELFQRSRRGVEPTEFCRMLNRHAHAVLSQLRLMADEINGWNAGASGQVVVGSLIVASVILLPRALGHLRESAPDVSVEIQVGVNETMFDALSRGDIDVAVGLLPPQEVDPDLVHVPLYEEHLCAVVGRHHPLVGCKDLSPEALARAHWIVPTPGSEAMEPSLRFFDALGLARPTRVVESIAVLANVGLLAESEMIALMPLGLARHVERYGQVAILPLPLQPFGKVGYTLSRRRESSPALLRLIAALHEISKEGL